MKVRVIAINDAGAVQRVTSPDHAADGATATDCPASGQDPVPPPHLRVKKNWYCVPGIFPHGKNFAYSI